MPTYKNGLFSNHSHCVSLSVSLEDAFRQTIQTCTPATLPSRQVSAHRALHAGAAAPGAVPMGCCLYSDEPGAGGSLEIICNTEGSHTYCFWAVEALIAHHMLSFLIKGLVSLTVAHVTPINLQRSRREEWDTTPIIRHWDAHCKIIKTKLAVKKNQALLQFKILGNLMRKRVRDLCLCLEVFPSVKAFKGKPDLSCNVCSFMLCSLDCGLQWCQKCTWSDCILSVSCKNDFEI